ncbi:MAG: hypothetical protein KBD17_00905 [Candidatus Pacebacteria bacterium]|nr:hypothetical protein [Candidatus Paceibacterota bacterium]
MDGISKLIATFSDLLSQLLPLLVSIGVIYFIWGVVRYVIADDEEAKQKGRDRIIFGIIGLAVIVSVWGLVGILNETFGVKQLGSPDSVRNLVSQSTSSSGCPLNKNLAGVLQYFTCLIGSAVIPFLFAVAVVSFIWGAIKFFIIDADEEAKREQGRQFMFWGIIALTVMISVWGLVGIFADTFNIQHGVLPSVKPN